MRPSAMPIRLRPIRLMTAAAPRDRDGQRYPPATGTAERLRLLYALCVTCACSIEGGSSLQVLNLRLPSRI